MQAWTAVIISMLTVAVSVYLIHLQVQSSLRRDRYAKKITRHKIRLKLAIRNIERGW